MKIILAEQLAAAIEPHLPADVEVVHITLRGELDGPIDDAEVCMAWGMPGSILDTILANTPHLRWLHTPSTGIDHLLPSILQARADILFTNSPGLHAIPIAEFVIAFLLNHAKLLPELRLAQTTHHWAKDLKIREVYETTLLIIGLGGIGQAIATRAAALGMHVWGSRRTPQPVPGVERVVGADGWRELLPEADYTVIAAPLTPETNRMVNETAFRAMRPTAYFINIARGQIVDEDALITALREEWIAGAALDAFSTEPLPPDSPLWDLPNVFITPHCTWTSPRMYERAAALFLENFLRYRNGEPLQHVVNREAGY